MKDLERAYGPKIIKNMMLAFDSFFYLAAVYLLKFGIPPVGQKGENISCFPPLQDCLWPKSFASERRDR